MKILRLFLVLLAALTACSKSEITNPPVNDNSNLVNTTYIDYTVMKKMEGIYKLNSGDNGLGTEFVCKTSRFRVSFFSNTGGIFIILKYGFKASDGSIQFAGFWRYSETTAQGNIKFQIPVADGSTDLMNGIINNLKLSGAYDGGQLSLKYDRAFSAYASSNEFMIFAHHGVLTTANPPFAENSLKGVTHDEDYGVNGLEFDVRMTKDNVPICIHDPSINVRLTLKGPLSGYWDQYNYNFISEYVRLIDNQKLPSVEECLTAFIDSTTMKYFWMDVKGNPGIFKALEPIVRNAYTRAASKGRNVVIFAGLPSQLVIDDFKTQPTYTFPTLAEESVDKAIANGSSYFGPRFTQGLLLDDINRAHSLGIKCIAWTLNDKALIRNYLQNGKYDGFITDYPAYVIYDFYTMF